MENRYQNNTKRKKYDDELNELIKCVCFHMCPLNVGLGEQFCFSFDP